MQMPTINPVLQQKCSWMPVSAIMYPGVLISYLRRFDTSRNTNIYLITSGILFAMGSLTWMLSSVISSVPLPFGLIAEPAMIGLVCLFAYNRKEISTLWTGKFYD